MSFWLFCFNTVFGQFFSTSVFGKRKEGISRVEDCIWKRWNQFKDSFQSERKDSLMSFIQDMMQRLKLVLEKEGAPCPTTELLQISLDSKLFLPNIKFIGGLSPARRIDALMRYDQSGLEALIFAAEGDMRNALNGSQLGRPGSFQRSMTNHQTNHLAKKFMESSCWGQPSMLSERLTETQCLGRNRVALVAAVTRTPQNPLVWLWRYNDGIICWVFTYSCDACDHYPTTNWESHLCGDHSCQDEWPASTREDSRMSWSELEERYEGNANVRMSRVLEQTKTSKIFGTIEIKRWGIEV